MTITIRDTFGNVLPPDTYFTYAVNSRYTKVQIGRVPHPGHPLRVATRCYGSTFNLLTHPKPNGNVLALDARLVSEDMKELLR